MLSREFIAGQGDTGAEESLEGATNHKRLRTNAPAILGFYLLLCALSKNHCFALSHHNQKFSPVQAHNGLTIKLINQTN